MLLQVGAYDTSCCSATHCCKYTVCEQEGKLRVDKGREGGAVMRTSSWHPGRSSTATVKATRKIMYTIPPLMRCNECNLLIT